VKIVLRILGTFLVVISLLLLIAVPTAGAIGIIIGVFCIIRSNQKLAEKITAYLKTSKEKSEQRAAEFNQKYLEQKQKNQEKAASVLIETSEGLTNQERMEKAGLKLYVWSTCGDERVCDPVLSWTKNYAVGNRLLFFPKIAARHGNAIQMEQL
jgi:hypothetical protein